MITFLICLALLITAYFTYGKFLERIIGVKYAVISKARQIRNVIILIRIYPAKIRKK